ncbi:MAG: polysaccharide deacetylase [Bacteroidales bacterium]|nr:polysaccharide deacetylase [Bacteroidales bacterium]
MPVIITAGQSNTDGRVSNDELPDYIQKHGYRHCLWSYGSGAISGGGHFERFWPRVAKPDNTNRWGYDAVVYYLIDRQIRRDFYVIKESLGGTAIDTACGSTSRMYWSASPEYLASTAAADKGGKSLLKAFTENIGACIDNELSHLKKGYEIKAFLWHQGESDKKMAGNYYSNLKAVVAYVRNYLVLKTGEERYARLPFICGTFSLKSRDRSEQVVEALHRLADEDPNFHVVDIKDATIQRDRLHFDSNGAELLGHRIYGKLIEVSQKIK